MPFVFAHDKISIEYIKPLERELSMRIRIIKARSGDCFVVDFENGHCILIDCGYSQTYKSSLFLGYCYFVYYAEYDGKSISNQLKRI